MSPRRSRIAANHLVGAADAAFSRVLAEHTVMVAEVAAYRPGEFYRRELPPLRAVPAAIDGLGLLVIDGYADLDPAGQPGLGVSAHRVFAVPVTGVATSAFCTATPAVPVLRGTSARPLYVTAAGMPRADAAQLVRRMTGRFRLPDALRRAGRRASGRTKQAQGGCVGRPGGSSPRVADCRAAAGAVTTGTPARDAGHHAGWRGPRSRCGGHRPCG